MSTGVRCPAAETNTLEIYTAPHGDLLWSSGKKWKKNPKGITRLISQHPRAWFAPNIGRLRICSLCWNPVWLVPASPRALMLAASETPTVTIARAKSACSARAFPENRAAYGGFGLASICREWAGQCVQLWSVPELGEIMISTAKGLLASDKDSVHTGMVRSHTAHIAWPQPLSALLKTHGHYPYSTEEKSFLFIAGVYGAWALTPGLYNTAIIAIIVNKTKTNTCWSTSG